MWDRRSSRSLECERRPAAALELPLSERAETHSEEARGVVTSPLNNLISEGGNHGALCQHVGGPCE